MTRAMARALAEYVYREACSDTLMYRQLYHLIQSGGSFYRDGVDMPLDVAATFAHYMQNLTAILLEYCADPRISRAIFGETLDYNMRRLMQV